MTNNLIRIVLPVILFSSSAFAQQPHPQKIELDYFFSPSCHACHKVREKIIARIEQEYKGKLLINFRDINSIENYKLFLGLKEQHNLAQNVSVPLVYFAGKVFYGEKGIFENLIKAIAEEPVNGVPQKEKIPAENPLRKFFSFTPLTVIGAGLLDGINPCAFTVIVFFISFLALQGYRKRELAGVGLFFIFAVFVTYLLLGLGVFSFFYSFKGFWAARKIFNVGIGALSLAFGIMAIKDFLKFKISGKTEGMSLQLPAAVKKQIQKVIGLGYRRDKGEVLGAPSGNMFKLAGTALVTGFLVSILEAVCTGQVYLPTITFVLKSTNVKLKAVVYLVLYNLMFILPLFVIFLCALMGTTSDDFTKFLKKHFLLSKVLMAVLFFGLGIYLVWRA